MFLGLYLDSTTEGKKLWKKYQNLVRWYYKGRFFKFLLYIPIYFLVSEILTFLQKQGSPLNALDDLYMKAQSFGFTKLARKVFDRKSFAALEAGDD